LGSEPVNEFKTQTVVGPDGSVTVQGLPFRAGETVEVTVASAAINPQTAIPSLHGSVLRYDDPTGPVAANEWEAVR
jgi:hypothetical protein